MIPLGRCNDGFRSAQPILRGGPAMPRSHKRMTVFSLLAAVLLFGVASLSPAPAMPIVIQHKMTFFALFGLDVNREFQYPRYFSMQPAGGLDPPVSFTKGFFEVAAAQNPKPQSLAIIAGDAEFPRNAAEGARKNAKDAGLKVVYDKTYPPTTTDYTPIVRAIDSTNPDVVLSLSYPPDAVGMVR